MAAVFLPANRGRQSNSETNVQVSVGEELVFNMVKQQRRTDRCFVPAAGNSVTWVRFPVGPVQRRHLQQVDRNNPHSPITTEEEREDPGPDEVSGDTKRARLDRTEDAAALTNREKVPGSCGQPGSESCPTAGGVGLNRNVGVTLVRLISAMCKQMCRPFCPVCKRHFRTPRKFVEHMKSAEHKEQVHLEEAQEEELITVDAVGCFEGEEEDEEKEVEEVEVAEEEEESVGKEEAEKEVSEVQPNVQAADAQKADKGEYDPHTTYGSSFVLPVSGFLCQLCNKFFYRETTARHTHCRTHTHYLNLQSHRAKKTHEDQDRSALN
ncbi:hypothetical protein FQN60_018306 [Etheostoma spectabile]|uniref:Matrin-type domain-containing protein n=1 Tax=Etheostoma spectabile TaxID=54343 RepID=A0A5J5DHU5_9PERO|nr:hypothetical protein FQN60_018306 [Etheostoma spectabile]